MARTHGRGGAGIRKTNKKGATKGSGGQRRKGLAGKGPTPKAEDRIYHAKHKAKLERDRRNAGRHQKETAEMVVGRNPVIECLHAKVPATSLYIVQGTRNDARLSEAVAMCNTRNIPILEVQRHEMDRMTGNGMHQGIGLQIPPYKYAAVEDLIANAAENPRPGMFVILDNITDPRNLGAIIRSTAAFGGQGVIVPQRRSVGLTASAWKTSAGAAARTPVAMAGNLNQTIKAFKDRGVFVLGLDGGGDTQLPELKLAKEPVLIVVGSEGKGLSRLVTENCDAIVSIPISASTESLNAGIAASVTLYEVSRLRGAAKKK